MLRRNFDVPPPTRLLQASVLVALATGIMVLAMHADNGLPRVATEATGSNVIVVP